MKQSRSTYGHKNIFTGTSTVPFPNFVENQILRNKRLVELETNECDIRKENALKSLKQRKIILYALESSEQRDLFISFIYVRTYIPNGLSNGTILRYIFTKK